MRDFEGLVAVVTGGASGIGAATVATLRERGATAIALDLTDPDIDGPFVRCDITSDQQVQDAVLAVRDAHGRLDVLVNNAGVGAQGDVSANDRAEWHRVLDVNVVSAARLSAAALAMLRESEHASIVNVSSVVAMVGVRNRALYSASKGAVHALTLAMAADHVAERIRVNCVLPGTASTPWIVRLLDSATDPRAEADALNARQPIGRLVSPEEVASAIAYLASPLTSSTVGTALTVDGGMGPLKV